jgi:hypothetical protein
VKPITNRVSAAAAALLIPLMLAMPMVGCADGRPTESVWPVVTGAIGSQDPLLFSTYLQTIKFIDDGMRYTDPLSRFFVSPVGELCFRTVPDTPQNIYDSDYRDWCMHPLFVDRVEVAMNDFTYKNRVRVWCRREYPQCAHRLGRPGIAAETPWVANEISAVTADSRGERAALEKLTLLMGGFIRPHQPADLLSIAASR